MHYGPAVGTRESHHHRFEDRYSSFAALIRTAAGRMRGYSATSATGPFTISHRSNDVDCSSLASVGPRAYVVPRQARSMWFTFLHLPRRLPYTGHWLLMPHSRLLPWPFSAQNQINAVGSNGHSGSGSGLGLIVATPLVRTSRC